MITEKMRTARINNAKKNFTKHGYSGTKIYHVWKGINQRCKNSNNQAYKNYGGRGITICDEWSTNFINFYNWSMENGYNNSLTIDRIDNNGNYEPNNCRWIDRYVQANNRRNNRIITYNGESHTLAEWGRINNISQKTIDNRLRCGWNIKDSLFTTKIEGIQRKKKKVNQYDLDGNFIKTWDSMTKVQNELHICRSNIKNCCQNKVKTSGGYIWKYSNEKG